MAQNDTLNLSLQLRDWKTIVGIMDGTTRNDYRRLKYGLQQHLAANPALANNDAVVVVIKEKTVIAIMEFFYGNTIKHLYKDNGANPFTRVTTAIRALVGTGTYLATSLTALDAANAAALDQIRNNGEDALNMIDI